MLLRAIPKFKRATSPLLKDRGKLERRKGGNIFPKELLPHHLDGNPSQAIEKIVKVSSAKYVPLSR